LGLRASPPALARRIVQVSENLHCPMDCHLLIEIGKAQVDTAPETLLSS
jgi:hypothetical protein